MSFDRRLLWLARAALAGLVVLGLAVHGQAQTTSASVSGTVQDQQGGMLPGVTVTLTSRTQGNALTAVTDPDGRFVFNIVRPDTYTLQAALQGFKTLEQTNVVVNANDRIAMPAFSMEVGAMTEEVTVSSRVSELQTTNGERSFALENAALTNIANNGRQLFNFARLVPGALPQGTSGQEVGSVSGFTVNGMRPNSNNMTIDGVANIDTGDNGGNMATTNIDAVAEFKVLTNSYAAEYGRATGAQVQVVTKSGSRDFHGSGYWYGRRSDWNANSWTNKRVTPEIPKVKANRNDGGYTIGGPVFFPGFNEDKRKLFFFFSQEYQRRTDPLASARETRVPTALERAGDFSQSVDASGNPFPYIRDYTTGLPCNASDTRGCFQDGGRLGKIPANRLYQPGMAILNIYPQANASGLGAGMNFTSQEATDSPRREDLLRMDYQITDKWRVTGRYMNTNFNPLQAYGTTWAGNGSDQLPLPVAHSLPGKNYMLSTTAVLSPTTSLEASWGRAANSLNYDMQLQSLYRSNSGTAGLPYLYPDAVQGDYVPEFQFRGGRTSNAGQYQTDRGPFTNENITHDVLANITKVWGSHNSKAGIYYQNSYKPQSIFASFNGRINFADDANNPFDSGYGYANAALGIFNTYTQANKFAIPEWRYTNFEYYVQDNWRAGRKLTLDYGVRFYHLSPQWDHTEQASNFLPDQFNPSAAAQLYRPVCLNAYPCSGNDRRGMDPRLVASGVAPSLGNTVEGRFIGRLTPDSNRFNGAFQAGQGINPELQDGSAIKISPRVGFVYDFTGEAVTILRGGWGIFYDRPQGNMVFDMIANAPGVLNSTVQWGTLQGLTSGGGDPNPVLAMNPTVYGFDPPKTTQWNLGVQRKLFKNFMFDLAYVGSTSDNLLRQVQINSLPFGATFAAANQDPTRAASTTPGVTALPTDVLRPYAGYGDIRMWDYSGYGNYHSLQTGINRRYDNGFMFSFFYVWSKALGINNDDFAAGVPNQTDEQIRRLDYSLTNYDRPHNFATNFVYQTPEVSQSKALGLLVNNWQISGVYFWTSGRPYSVGFNIPGIGATNLTGTNNPNARIALTCDPGAGYSDDPYRQFDTSCFAPPQPGSDGAESARFFVHAPPINNLDLSFSKTFALPKNMRFEFRVDMFNALNHTQFTGVNATANFASLTDRTITNLPYDASGALVRPQGFGAINGVAPARNLQVMTRFTF
jgi:hypothetical protein